MLEVRETEKEVVEHLRRLERAWEARRFPVKGGRRARFSQAPRREAERAAKIEALAFCNLVVVEGGTARLAAGLLRLSPRTLSGWRQSFKEAGLPLRARGRLLVRSAREMRSSLIEALEKSPPRLAVRTLWGRWPEMARREVEEIACRYRVLRERHRLLSLESLAWEVPGAVWAMDHGVPPRPVDGVEAAILSVRDLATGFVLGWEAVWAQSASITCAFLELLFRQHGPPLVLKSDNGPAFIAGETRRLLDRWGVIPLLSPVRRPQYNGAVEAGIRWLKERTEEAATPSGRASQWTRPDLDCARRQTNMSPRSHKQGEPPREMRWRCRAGMSVALRQDFIHTVREEEKLGTLGASSTSRGALSERVLSTIRRQAVRRALVAHGLLHIHQRRRVPPVLRSFFCAKIA